MKVLFVKNITSYMLHGIENSIVEPLEFEYLAASIPHHDVNLIDLLLEQKGYLENTINEYKPDVVASTANTVDVYAVNRLMENVKKMNPEILTVVGGYHPAKQPEDFNNENIDVIAIGAGDHSFRQVVDNFEAGRGFESIPGLALPRDGELIFTEEAPLSYHPDTLPFPDKNITKKYCKKYHCEFWKPVAMMRNIQGCYFACKFCALSSLTGYKLFEREPIKVCEELETLPQKYVFFCDDLSFRVKNPERMHRLCDKIEKRGNKKYYYLTARTDAVANNPDLIEKMVKIGMRRMFLGLEGYTDTGLDFWNKKNRISTNEEAINILHKNGVDIIGSFIITPDYTEDDFKRLFEYVEKINILDPAFLIYTPHPGVEVHKEKNFGKIIDNFELYDHLHSVFETKLPPEKFYKLYSKLWYDAYSPFSSKGYKRFWKIIYRISPGAIPVALKMTLHFFKRSVKGNTIQYNYNYKVRTPEKDSVNV